MVEHPAVTTATLPSVCHPVKSPVSKPMLVTPAIAGTHMARSRASDTRTSLLTESSWIVFSRIEVVRGAETCKRDKHHSVLQPQKTDCRTRSCDKTVARIPARVTPVTQIFW